MATEQGGNVDEAIIRQVENIQKEISETQQLVGRLEDIMTLQEVYQQDDTIFQNKIKHLSKKYSHIRTTRADGNCFFRAFGFSYLEYLLGDRIEYDRFRNFAANSKDELVALGFPSFTVEDFHDTFMELVDRVGEKITVDELLTVFQDEGMSNYIVVYLRLLTSAQLQKKEDFFENFIEGSQTMKDFCSQEVEPMSRESDNIHIIALSDATGVCIRIEHLDRSGPDSSVNHHDFPDDGSKPMIYLLYKPGHYDILYRHNK
ncbi:ubiquitin thioesterase OTUB1-like [Dendronephthya gigantea]|uniref:ubiquitin thioesterase OTUB1-like n=1 Tax=Dendronephthya gigantea TaxID=151771 RepID=UPI00106C908E|nr:ubiquitin thioesterase OTUB1-like [Dendronephthya gigantea]